MSHPFPFNPGAPYVIAPVITSTDFDLSQVTDATIEVADPNGVTQSFAGVVGTATQSGSTWSLTISYALATGDLAVAGAWSGEVRMTTPDGTIVSDRFLFNVRRALGT